MPYTPFFRPVQAALLAGCVLLAGCAGPTARQSATTNTTATATAAATTAAAAPRLSAGQSSDIAIHALGLVGTPYRYGGNTPEGGFDCSGLIGYVYQSSAAAPPRTVAQLDQWGQPVDGAALRSGDLVLFGRGPSPSHAGIYVGEGRFVHAPSSGGTVRMDRLDARHWVQQSAGFRRP